MVNRRSESRLFVEVPGSYQAADAAPCDIVFSAISSNGCRLNHVAPHVGVGDVVAVNLGPIGPMQATVRWRRESSAGVQFHEQLEAAVVDFFAAFCGAAA